MTSGHAAVLSSSGRRRPTDRPSVASEPGSSIPSSCGAHSPTRSASSIHGHCGVTR